METITLQTPQGASEIAPVGIAGLRHLEPSEHATVNAHLIQNALLSQFQDSRPRPVAMTLPGAGPRNYHRPDKLILDDVAKAIAFDSLFEASDLEIECKEGRVDIRGNVELQSAKSRLEVLLASVFGVKEVNIKQVTVNKGIPPPPATNAARDRSKNTKKKQRPK